MTTQKVKVLSDLELQKIFGGGVLVKSEDCVIQPNTSCPNCVPGADSKDCTSEAASGGGTTDSE